MQPDLHFLHINSSKRGGISHAGSAPDSVSEPAADAQLEHPPLVMLHGWMHSSRNLKPLAELLAGTREVYVIDLPGFGQSPKPDADWGTDEYMDRIIAFLDEHKLQTVDLLGHSFGGRISIRLCAKYPERVRRLVLMASHGLRPVTRSKKWLRLKYIALIRGTVRLIDRYFDTTYYKEQFIPRFASPDYLNAGPMLGIFLKTVREDLTDVAPAIEAKTLLVWGEKDIHTPVEMAERFEKLIPNSSLKILPGKGHEPFGDSGSHLCASVIKEFLDQK